MKSLTRSKATGVAALGVVVATTFLAGALFLPNVRNSTETRAQGAPDGQDPVGSSASPSPARTPIPDVAESGRLQFSVHADGVSVDENGKELPGGFAVNETCEADAVVGVQDGKVSEVLRLGTANAVSLGESVLHPDARDSAPITGVEGEMQVYKDQNGHLRAGCDPDSWKIISIE